MDESIPFKFQWWMINFTMKVYMYVVFTQTIFFMAHGKLNVYYACSIVLK